MLFSQEAFDYFVFNGEISNQTFVPLDKEIFILNKKGKLKRIQEVDPFFNSTELSQLQQKYFLCFPKVKHLL